MVNIREKAPCQNKSQQPHFISKKRLVSKVIRGFTHKKNEMHEAFLLMFLVHFAMVECPCVEIVSCFCRRKKGKPIQLHVPLF